VAAVQRVLVRPGTDPAAAVVAMDPRNGHVLAYVGGPDYYGGQPWARYDLAGQGNRSAGSTFKPFVLATALEEGTPLSRTYSAPGAITIPIRGQQPWVVNNYDGSGSGQMTLLEATVRSVNTVYAQLIMDLGAQPVVDLAAKMGVKSKLGAFPSAALGTNGVTVLDMASSYSTFAADGSHIDPVFVTRVSDSTGRVLWRAAPARSRVLDSTTSREVTGVLQQVVERGTAVNAKIGRPVAGKTGTGEEWSDAWFVGYTPEFVAAVWVGFPDAVRTMRPPATRITVTGGSWPAQIWQGLAGAYLAEVPASTFPLPDPPKGSETGPTGSTGPGLASVIGLEVDTASRLLVDAGLRVRIVEATSRVVPQGRVISQSPNARHLVSPGDAVTLTVSTGPPAVVTVPSVLGLTSTEAVAALADAGFQTQLRLEAEPPPGDPARAQRIWKQVPSGGTTQAVDEAVLVWVNP
jgi:penicillin-binding protein 1A